MTKQIVIGKEGTQPFVLNDPLVSRRHATLTIQEGTGILHLVDNSSTNGTFIYNGTMWVRLYPNQPYQVSPDTMIRLGTATQFHVRRLLQPVVAQTAHGVVGGAGVQAGGVKPAGGAAAQPAAKPASKKPKRVCIKKLRSVSDNYTMKKMSLDSKMNTVNGLRTFSIVVSMLAGTGGKLISDQLGFGADSAISWVIGIALAVVLVSTLLVCINRYQSKVMKARTKNEHDYAVNYCCPECHVSFKGRVYENILAEGQCPKCKAEFYE